MTSTDQRVPPMGSEADDTPYTENVVLNKQQQNYPNYDTWKLGFQELLDDPEGYKTYYEFLGTEQLTVLFDCWYCCQEYRYYPPNKAKAKDVYSRYVRIKDSRVPLSDQARNNLAMRIRANDVTETLLSEIESEVYANLRDICYPKFLKSDFFTFYCETSGQIQYAPSEFHKCNKPSTLKRGKKLNVVNEGEITNCLRTSHDIQQEYSSHHSKGYHPPLKCHDLQSLSSDAHTESDKLSMTDSRISTGSTGRCSRNPRSHNHDQLQDISNFQPRTQRISKERMRQKEPKEFAALLTQKLEKVISDRQARADNENMLQHGSTEDSKNMKNLHHSSSSSYNHRTHYGTEYEPSECDTQSWHAPPMSDRYSVAGQSSHSGSHSGVMVNKKAKELRDIVHHQLRNDLGECKCDNCVEQKFHQRYYGNNGGGSQHSGSHHRYPDDKRYAYHQSSPSYYSHSSRHGNDYHHSHSTVEEVHHRPEYYHDAGMEHPDVMPPVDNRKIYKWMEQNERYQQQESFANPAPSPQIGRRKKPVAYDTSRAVQPIAQDPGMPMLPPPDTGNVLEEVKRVLKEPRQRNHSSHHGTLSKKSISGRSRTNGYIAHEMYTTDMYDKNSMASAPWSMSDSASCVSCNPSQISTVPSSASRLWNAQGYIDNGSEVRDERIPSDVRSHSTGRSGSRSVTRSDHIITNARTDHHSDVRSQSTGYGSDNSKGGSKTKTVITYFYGVDPIPFRINIPTIEVTLGQFKAETKKGNYRFFFKTVSNVDGEVVYEEVKNDDDVLPKYNDKIVGKVEKIE